MAWGGNLKSVVKKYGRVAIGVHLSVSGLCFSGCYLAILSSVDVESMLEKVGLGSWLPPPETTPQPDPAGHVALSHSPSLPQPDHVDSRQPEGSGDVPSPENQGILSNINLAKGGGAFAMAWLCNKALFPVRVPITIGLTPPVWRFLTSRGFRV